MPVAALAVCFPKADTAELVEVKYHDPTPGQMIVRMKASGISAGTEGSIFRGIRTHNGTFPLITGYQGAGVVEWVGTEVEGYEVGDRVAVTGVCSRLLEPDLQIVWGTHASRVVVEPRHVHHIPEGVSDDEAALCTVWAVGLHGATVAGVQSTDTVLVVGLGLIGLSLVQTVVAMGAEVVGLDRSEERAAICRSLGAQAFTSPEQVQAWLQARGLRGFSVTAEATGHAQVIDIPLQFAAPEAKVIWQGWYPGRVDFEYHQAHAKQLSFHFPTGTGGHQPRMLRLIAQGLFRASALISHRFPVQDCQQAYNLAVLQAGQSLGVVLEWPQ